MVEEIFTAAKMEEDGNRPLLRRIDLAALVRLAALDSQVAGRPVEVEAPAACEVRADPEAVRRIVGNLIENAHKYGEAPVRITVQPADDQVVLSVVDHGTGVPAGDAREGLRALLPGRPERHEARNGPRARDRARAGRVVWWIGVGRGRARAAVPPSGSRCGPVRSRSSAREVAHVG